MFESGQLAQIQKSLSIETDAALRRLAGEQSHNHPLSSPVLVNHLQTLTLSIPPLEPRSLLQPVISRKSQLMSGTTDRLQASAYRILLSSLSTATGGVTLAWFSYVSPMSMLSAASATGCGILSVVAALAVGQRLWRRSQRRFWSDWDRITAMLHGDLKVCTLKLQLD